MDDIELWKAILGPLGAFAPFSVLAYWIMRTQAATIAAKDAQLAALNEKVLTAFNASTTALVEVRAELRAQS